MDTMETLGSSRSRGEISLPADVCRASSGSFHLVVNAGVESAGHVGPGVINGVVRVGRNINVESFMVPNTPPSHVDGRVSPCEP